MWIVESLSEGRWTRVDNAANTASARALAERTANATASAARYRQPGASLSVTVLPSPSEAR